MSDHLAGQKPLYHNLPSYLLSDVDDAKSSFVKRFVCSAFVNLSTGLAKAGLRLLALSGSIPASWVLLMARLAAPLRKIVSRELSAYQPDPNNSQYAIYCLIDTLECGHEQSFYLYDGLLDVLNAYTQNPAVKAKRHRCRPCASLLLSRKPVQSVAIGKPAVAA